MQRLRVSCALCNNFQAARPRQTTERRLAPLYVEHMPSYLYSGGSGLSIDIHFVDLELSYDVLSPLPIVLSKHFSHPHPYIEIASFVIRDSYL